MDMRDLYFLTIFVIDDNIKIFMLGAEKKIEPVHGKESSA